MFYCIVDLLLFLCDFFMVIVLFWFIVWIMMWGVDGWMNFVFYFFFNVVVYILLQVVVLFVGDKFDWMQGKDILFYIFEIGSFCINIVGYEDCEVLN